MSEIFDMVWQIMLFLLGIINTLIGYLLDIKFLDMPILVYFVFFDLLARLILRFGGNSIGASSDDDDEDDLIDDRSDDDD